MHGYDQSEYISFILNGIFHTLQCGVHCSYLYLCNSMYHSIGTKADADAISMKVQRLNQNRLPQMYQRGSCPEGDLRESGSFIMQPQLLLLVILAAMSCYILE